MSALINPPHESDPEKKPRRVSTSEMQHRKTGPLRKQVQYSNKDNATLINSGDKFFIID